MMNENLLQYLRCPKCSTILSLNPDLCCHACQKNVHVLHGIPRFVEADHEVENFSFEWHRHDKTQLDSAKGEKETEQEFFKKTGFLPEELRGKVVLDAGCGTGRFMEIVSPLAKEVVGVDLSYSVDDAAKNLQGKTNVHLIQADLLNLPFKQGIFDVIYSIGVLHHTVNTRKAFENLVPLLKPGGIISIWVYPFPPFLYRFASDCLRFFTTRMKPRNLYQWVKRADRVLYPFHSRGRFFRYLFPIPMSHLPDQEKRLLDTFDWYSPKYQWKHTMTEVTAWFEEAGLKNIRALDAEVTVRGEK